MIFQYGFNGRKDFGRFLNERGLSGVGVEIGTHRGDFAKQVAALWVGKKMYCVDPYVDGYCEGDPVSDRTAVQRLDDYRHAFRLLETAKNPTVNMLRSTSEYAATEFDNEQLDWVYVDGNHQRDAVQNDLLRWYPRVKSGGVIAGHDIICPGANGNGWGANVQPAVSDVCRNLGIETVFLITEHPVNDHWSYYFFKP